MSSSDYIPLGPKSVVPHLNTIKNRIFTQNNLSGGSLNYHLGRRGPERHGIGGHEEELRRWLVVNIEMTMEEERMLNEHCSSI